MTLQSSRLLETLSLTKQSIVLILILVFSFISCCETSDKTVVKSFGSAALKLYWMKERISYFPTTEQFVSLVRTFRLRSLVEGVDSYIFLRILAAI